LEDTQSLCEQIPDCIGITQIIDRFELRGGYQCRRSIGQNSWIQKNKIKVHRTPEKIVKPSAESKSESKIKPDEEWEYYEKCYLSGYPRQSCVNANFVVSYFQS